MANSHSETERLASLETSVERVARVERTASEERLGDIERRLTRLEERVRD